MLVGVAGGEFGVRGFVQAFDAQTGKSAWKTYTIPAPGEPGSDTWQKADTWKTGGASTWMTGNYDADTNTVYWGTGNASPWFGDQRPGDNLYTSSTVALDGDTGKIKGHFQYHQNEFLGLGRDECPDAGGLPEGRRDDQGPAQAGAQRLPVLAQAQPGRRHLISAIAKPYVQAERLQEHRPRRPGGLKSTWRTSRPPASRPQFCPGLWGGKDWPYEAYNPKTGLVYIPSNENHCGTLEGKVEERVPGQWWTGVAIPDIALLGRHQGAASTARSRR